MKAIKDGNLAIIGDGSLDKTSVLCTSAKLEEAQILRNLHALNPDHDVIVDDVLNWATFEV